MFFMIYKEDKLIRNKLEKYFYDYYGNYRLTTKICINLPFQYIRPKLHVSLFDRKIYDL